ncbi:MAG TPA: peptide chain release factor N(5)-glutamine methyltransferase [Candidatus Sulfopaludibacter sp.]|nr:peptide chain release factor N(5)-glutamine methyltransferase [Candidatus Sulfopaludibacter sp.]
MTVLEAIQKSAEFLAKKGVESPRLQTELLLAHLLKLPRMKLYLNFERVLTPAETDALREFIRRRGQREPLQHITGSTSFCGLEMAVNRHALIPRPETELLAEEGWKFLKGEGRRVGDPNSGTAARRPSQNDLPAALDLGTGTGCLAIALAVKCPGTKIVATDISADALTLAKENAARNGVAERIEFFQGEGLAALQPEGRIRRVTNLKDEKGDLYNSSLRKFDLVISNPPYLPSAEIATLQPEVRDFDPRAALDGGADGLDFYRMLSAQAKPLLKAAGQLMLEFGDGQAAAIQKIFEAEKWIVAAVKEDYSHRARILIAKL